LKPSVTDVTIVLPTLNEEAAIGTVLDEIVSEGYSRILVVDGYSKDGTAEIARARGVEVVEQHWKGKTGALKTAFDRVTTPYLLVMDCDGTYDPKDISKFLSHAPNYDEIIGARQRKTGMPLVNRFGNKVINLLFTLFTGWRVTDVGSGMYLLRTSVARSLELQTTGIDSEVEILVQTSTLHRVTEVPINYRRRIGDSKLSPVRDGLSDVWTIMTLSRLYNPVQFFSTFGSLLIIPGTIIMLWGSYETFVRGVWHFGWILLGLILVVFALQAFGVAAISLAMGRLERRLTRGMPSASAQS
jgi:glycosyltransferase involved in cell wall biosynthesis